MGNHGLLPGRAGEHGGSAELVGASSLPVGRMFEVEPPIDLPIVLGAVVSGPDCGAGGAPESELEISRLRGAQCVASHNAVGAIQANARSTRHGRFEIVGAAVLLEVIAPDPQIGRAHV